MITRFIRARTLASRLALLGLLATLLLALAACPRAGHFLIINEPVRPADALVVLSGARVERWLEAVDLYKEGKARQIVLSSGIIEAAEIRLRESGVRFPSSAELIRSAMVEMGIPDAAITIFPEAVDNTAHEAVVAHRIALERGWKSLIVVTSAYHTRRTRFAFRREMNGSGIDVQVAGTRYDEARPDEWWKHRADFRYVISELQKLAAYRLGLSQ